MVGEWPETTWGDIAELKYGKAMTAYTDQPNLARVYGTNGPIGWHDTALQSGPGVIIGRKGAYRGVHYADQPFWVIDTAYYLNPLVPMDLRWAYYWLLDYDVNNIDDGSPIPSTTREAFGFTPVKFPPLDEQSKIAHLLASLDAKIDLNRQMAATLEEMAQALFKSWFVDFDPVHAKAEGRNIGLPADIAALFPDSFHHEGLPAGWSHEPLLKFAYLISGGTPKTDNAAYWNGEIPWASAKDVSQCGQLFLQTTERTITERGLRESSTKVVPANSTVVVARGATTGRNCLFGIDMAMNQTCYALKSNEGFDFWFNLCFKNEINRIIASAHGSAFDTITTVTLQNASIVPADKNVRSAFEKQVFPLYQRVLFATNEATELKNLRDYLLPKLISGEIRVADAEAVTAAA
ncbi:restriction endonuclease subunit S [Sphingobium aromaticivastans]|uniref:restriction endonuclease subunit S n=1 Tax=Sphingobium aromaticivastans TaxID=1778665 RepID=UPI003015D0B7